MPCCGPRHAGVARNPDAGSRARLREVLAPPATPFGAFSAESLADQVEWLKISPQFLSAEELSKLWTAAQARFRASMSYHVSVVLIQSEAAVRAALPVLRRGPDDRGPRALAATPPRLRAIDNLSLPGLRAGRLGDLLRLQADGVGADTELVFEHARTGLRQALPLQADGPRRWQGAAAGRRRTGRVVDAGAWPAHRCACVPWCQANPTWSASRCRGCSPRG